jgi:hypothetical protein
VIQYRQQTSHISDFEERVEKMQELAEKSHAAVSNAIEEVQADVEYDPTKFLGIFVLYSDTLWSIFVTVATLAFALMQQ